MPGIAELRSKEMQLESELAELKAQGRPKLTMDNLARIIELWTKIPASSIREDELERLSKLDERLREHIVGQDEAISAVCAAIKRNRIGLQVKRKPVSFIFVGGTGVGKTELVKRLAADLVRLAGVADTARHVGVHGEILRLAHHRLASRLRRL